MGPTATGKTDLAIELAQQFPEVEIISADSALVYKGLDKGTAKPSREQLAQTPHWLIDICDPSQVYSAGDFYKDALQAIKNIHAKNKIPLVVGGTPLYFKILQEGIAELPPADMLLRKEITAQAKVLGWEKLHHQLAQIDPISAAKINPQDGQRIQRALEIYQLTGKSIRVFHQTDLKQPYHFYTIILMANQRDFIHQRIKIRLEKFFHNGLIEEVTALRQRPDLHADLPSMRLVGYRQTWEYLEGRYDFTTLQEKIYFATCQLVKRQCTWHRRWLDAKFIPIDESSIPMTEIYNLCHKIVFNSASVL